MTAGTPADILLRVNLSGTDHAAAGRQQTFSPARFLQILRAYRSTIILSLAMLITAYVIGAAVVILLSPARRVTTLPFRLEFEGAEVGRYPNGMKFSATDIIGTPVLTTVFHQNAIGEIMPFHAFSRAVYVLEANRALERLSLDYQARLADPKLSPIDRDRIQREFESKRESISKNEYSLNYISSGPAAKLPTEVVQKVLVDILREWTQFSAREQRVLQYRVSVLSPEVVGLKPPLTADYIVALQMLRSKIRQVLDNIKEVNELPGAALVRTEKEKVSLHDMQVQLQDLLRFRLEPLVSTVRSSGLVADPAATLRFLESQLAHDELVLLAARENAEIVSRSLAAYSGTVASPARGVGGEDPREPAAARRQAQTSEAVLSDTFLDRLIDITSAARDVTYRQRLVDDYRQAAEDVVPAEQAVAYDRMLLEQLRNAATGGSTVSAEEARNELATMHAEVYRTLQHVTEIYLTTSRNLNPTTQMLTMTGVPVTKLDRAVSLGRIVTLGILLTLLALPLILGGVLLHNRINSEEPQEPLESQSALKV